jgi:hypothetical protein
MIAPMVLDGPNNREAFLAYVDQVLAPKLRPGDVVIMDNLSSHKGADAHALGQACSIGLKFGLYGGRKPKVAPAASISCRRNCESRRAHPRPLGRHRPYPRPVTARRERQLLRPLRLRCKLIGNRSMELPLILGQLQPGVPRWERLWSGMKGKVQ